MSNKIYNYQQALEHVKTIKELKGFSEPFCVFRVQDPHHSDGNYYDISFVFNQVKGTLCSVAFTKASYCGMYVKHDEQDNFEYDYWKNIYKGKFELIENHNYNLETMNVQNYFRYEENLTEDVALDYICRRQLDNNGNITLHYGLLGKLGILSPSEIIK